MISYFLFPISYFLFPHARVKSEDLILSMFKAVVVLLLLLRQILILANAMTSMSSSRYLVDSFLSFLYYLPALSCMHIGDSD